MRTKTDKVTLAEIRLSGICPSCKEDKNGPHHDACIRRKQYVNRELIMSFNPNRQKLTCRLSSVQGSMTYKCTYEDHRLVHDAWREAATLHSKKSQYGNDYIVIQWD